METAVHNYLFHCNSSCRAVLDVVVKPSSGLSSPRQRQLEQLISGCCGAVLRRKLHPHTAISITLQVEHDGGSVSSSDIAGRDQRAFSTKGSCVG